MWPPTLEDIHFDNVDYTKNVVHIMPIVELMVNFSNDMMRAKKACLLYTERMDFKELIQVRLAEKSDRRKMYISTIDSSSFHELKQSQSLNVTFAGFLDNLVRLLKDCQVGSLELCLAPKDPALVQSNIECQNYYLQFVEIRTFKNLVHLCLPCRLAPVHTVLFYLNAMLDATQKKICLSEQNTQQLQLELSSQQTHIEQLIEDNKKIREALTENIQNLSEKHAAEIQKMQEKISQLNEQRSNDLDRSRRTIANIQTQVDKAIIEKTDLIAQQEKSEARIQSLNEELVCCRSRVSSLKEQNEKLHGDLTAAKKQERKLDHQIGELKHHAEELKEHLQQCNKDKANIAADLEAEKKILQTKRNALQMASEEIAKANQIILKQNHDLVNQKKTIAWRTEVALQQEKAITEKEKLLNIREDEIREARATIVELRDEIPKQLISMRQFAKELEAKYANQIQMLKQRLSALSNKENSANKANSARRK